MRHIEFAETLAVLHHDLAAVAKEPNLFAASPMPLDNLGCDVRLAATCRELKKQRPMLFGLAVDLLDEVLLKFP